MGGSAENVQSNGMVFNVIKAAVQQLNLVGGPVQTYDSAMGGEDNWASRPTTNTVHAYGFGDSSGPKRAGYGNLSGALGPNHSCSMRHKGSLLGHIKGLGAACA